MRGCCSRNPTVLHGRGDESAATEPDHCRSASSARSTPDEPTWMAQGGLISDSRGWNREKDRYTMSFITKRRLASLVTASALIATLAVASMPSAALAAPQLNDWPARPKRVQLDPQQGDRECPELRVRGPPRRSSATPSLWAARRGSFRRCPSSSPAGRAVRGLEHGRRRHDAGSHVRRAERSTSMRTTTARRATCWRRRPRRSRWRTDHRPAHLHRRPLVQLEGQRLLQRHDPDGHDADADRHSLPDEVIWTVQYNTSHDGPNPDGCAEPRRLAERWS